MNLKIFSESDNRSEITGDDFVVSTQYLNYKGLHFYLASQHWGNLYCELDETIPEGCLKYLVKRCESVEVKLPETVTKKIMLLCIELYPDKQAQIRKQFITGKELKDVLC